MSKTLEREVSLD